MSTRIHKKISLTPPLLYVSESITLVSPASNVSARSKEGVLLYFLGGEAMLSINGGSPALVREGSVVIVPGPSYRTYSATSPSALPMHFYGISYSLGEAKKSKNTPNHTKELAAILKMAFSQSTVLTGEETTCLRQRLLALRHGFDDRDPAAAVLIYTAALDLCVETARLILNRKSWHDSALGRRKSRTLVNNAQEYMLRNLKHNPNVETIAWSVKVSSEHLCRIFRKELGTTPRNALRGFQMDEAKSLLINSPLEIYRVAEQTGFSSVTAFCRYFKSASGVTPTEYRAANIGNFVT